MRRILATLSLVALLVSAGCLGAAGTASPDGSDGSPTDTPYADRTVEWPDGPEDRPTRPATLNESSVREFVRTHEYRYAYNQLWMGETTDVNLECEVSSVTPAGDGYEATVSCTGYAETGGGDGTATATIVHADWGTQEYHYYVDDDSLLRQREPFGEGDDDTPSGEA